MLFRIQCSNCGRFLTGCLEPVPVDFDPDWPDCKNMIPRGHYWIAHDIQPERLNGHCLINLDDRFGLGYHPEARRHSGCCGRDGCDGPNQVCECGAEVATEVSDCWTSYFAHFETDAVALISVTDSATILPETPQDKQADAEKRLSPTPDP